MIILIFQIFIIEIQKIGIGQPIQTFRCRNIRNVLLQFGKYITKPYINRNLSKNLIAQMLRDVKAYMVKHLIKPMLDLVSISFKRR